MSDKAKDLFSQAYDAAQRRTLDLFAFTEGAKFGAEIERERQPKALALIKLKLAEEIFKWHLSWMNVQGTDDEDRKAYFDRASGIDSNMKYDLADRLIKMLEDTSESIP